MNPSRLDPQLPLEERRSYERRRRGLRYLKTVPILPSVVTLGNLFFGFLAMAKVADAIFLSREAGASPATNFAVIAKLEVAALLIFLAMVFDALDGAVARATKQTSAFGAQLDSLCDMVTFGVAPALMAKVLIDLHVQGDPGILPPHPKLYYIACAVYVLCAAMRLARFNVEVRSDDAEDHVEFAGLPSPAAAAIVASAVAFFASLKLDPTRKPEDRNFLSDLLQGSGVAEWIVYGMPVALALIGLLMVSRFPYPHVLVNMLKGRHSFPFLAGLVVFAAMAALEWQFAVVVLVLIYVVYGMLLGMFRLVTRGRFERRDDLTATQLPDADEPDEPDDRFGPHHN